MPRKYSLKRKIRSKKKYSIKNNRRNRKNIKKPLTGGWGEPIKLFGGWGERKFKILSNLQSGGWGGKIYKLKPELQLGGSWRLLNSE